MEDSEKLEPTPGPLLSEPAPNRKRLGLAVVAVLSLALVSLLAVKSSTQKELHASQQPIDLAEGNEIPDLQMTRVDGSKISLSDLPHKVMMINFWATWCEACMEEMPSLVQLRDLYAPKGFEILGINVDENPHPIATTAATKFGVKFPIFTDPGNQLSEIFDVHAIPLTVIISKSRKILMVEPGGRDWNSDEVHQLIEKWLSE